MFDVSNFDPKTLSWWFDQKDNIDMDPPYQRRGQLWSKQDKAFLIDSILNGYDMPKIYIADFSFGKLLPTAPNKQYAVIDGKQRLSAIFEFFESQISLDENFVYSISPELQLGGLNYKDLQNEYPKIANKFSNFNLSAMRVITDDEARINEMFVRLNRSKPLSGAEIRNAMNGVVPDLIRRLSQHEFFANKISFSTTRKQDQNIAAKILLLEYKGSPVGTQKPNIDKLVQEGISAESNTQDFIRACDRAERILSKMASSFDNKDALLKRAGPVSVYYWFFREQKLNKNVRFSSYLKWFNELREANRRAPKNRHDTLLAEFDRQERSVDNQGSIEFRCSVLEKYLEIYV